MTVVSNQRVDSTDHVSFDELGLPGFQFRQREYGTIQAEDLMKNAVTMASYAWHAAIADARMPQKSRR